MKSPALLTPREAAESIGVSYATMKGWILSGKVKTVRTAGGHHRIPAGELDAYLPRQRKGARNTTVRTVSGRNQLIGRVVDVRVDGLMAKVVLSIGEQRITSVITADAVEDLAIKKGDVAIALIKSTEVMIAKP